MGQWFYRIHSMFVILSLGNWHRQKWHGSSLVQVMACHQYSTKPLPEPILTYWQLDSYGYCLQNVAISLTHWGQDKMADIFQTTFSNAFLWMMLILIKFVPKCSINNIPAFVRVMAWHFPGDKPISKPMMLSSLTHKSVILPQWVKLYLLGAQWQIYHRQYIWEYFLQWKYTDCVTKYCTMAS